MTEKKERHTTIWIHYKNNKSSILFDENPDTTITIDNWHTNLRNDFFRALDGASKYVQWKNIVFDKNEFYRFEVNTDEWKSKDESKESPKMYTAEEHANDFCFGICIGICLLAVTLLLIHWVSGGCA